MNDEQSQKQITCREFYSTVGSIFLMVGVLALTTIPYEVGDSLLSALCSIPVFLIAFTALGAGLVYTIKALTEKSKQGR